MKRKIVYAASLLVALIVCGRLAVAEEAKVKTVYDFVMKDIDGKDVKLEKFRGKVALIVNVASQCGYTPQYEGLEALHAKYAAKGLVVMGFPSNDFGQQEPGSSHQQVLAANVDVLAICEPCHPSPAAGRVERLLALLGAQHRHHRPQERDIISV